ncbi:MAG TPA: CehA/McbA family metallohydrolase [Thermoanaerobaculia bacterium]|nr:CehA/McbA family metallohydrolase [Thermoanaerobaculia bacterium]
MRLPGPRSFPLLRRRSTALAALAALALLAPPAGAQRRPVLPQVEVPHSYYYREMYLPQRTTGPSALTWSPDGLWLAYSMDGSLWRQRLGTQRAEQLTDGPHDDYQPDWSPDGRSVVFSRYDGAAVELQLLDLESGSVRPLTAGGAVHVDARWSPDGSRLAWVSTARSGRFSIFVAEVGDGLLAGRPLRPERRSEVARYYYSPWDHELSPSWSPDGRQILFVANPEVGHGTGDLYRIAADGSGEPTLVRSEETNWKARPDWSPTDDRVVYASYLGRQWHQLWLTTAQGGPPLPLSYGDWDVTAPRWSPDATRIAYVSNRQGGLRLMVQEAIGGAVAPVVIAERRTLRPHGRLVLTVADPAGRPLPARVSVRDAHGRAWAPDGAWMHADDGFDRRLARVETRYFHTAGVAELEIPAGAAEITVWRGLETGIARRSVMLEADRETAATVVLEPLELPGEWAEWVSGDVHLHMNYGGAYRATPATLIAQMRAEDLDVAFNLVVNKEQRIPDVSYFSPDPDPASGADALVLHAQEFHTSLWGHLGLLGLDNHLLLPDYAAYPATGVRSPYPTNAAVADLAHRQNALVGYVHPFDPPRPDPAAPGLLAHSLPVDVALGKVDYYEVVGFSDHLTSAGVWHDLLDCGFRVAAAGGTDAMTNYASLRGPVGLNRTYVRIAPETPAGSPRERLRAFVDALRAGRSMATNGPLVGLTVEGEGPGAELALGTGPRTLSYRGFLRSVVPVDRLELLHDGRVVESFTLDGERTRHDVEGTLEVEGDGWILLRAWSEGSHPDVFDLYPYATTGPIYLRGEGERRWPRCDADGFLAWVAEIEATAGNHPDYNTDAEREATLESIRAARRVFEALLP